MKYCRYGFSAICSTSSLSEYWNFVWMMGVLRAGHAQGLRHISCSTGKQVCVFGLELIPWDAVGHLYPPIVRVHMQPHRLVEVKERMLDSVAWSIHCIYFPFNDIIQGELQNIDLKSRHYLKGKVVLFNFEM